MDEPKIIYEDEDFIAVNKSAGLLTHPTEKSDEPTLVDWLIEKYPEIKKVGDFQIDSGQANLRPGIVHRLDKDTSGVLLVARNQKAFEFLKEQFKNRKIKKKYVALVCGRLKSKEGVIDLPIGKSKKDFRRKTSRGKLAGVIRDAVTEYKTKEIFPDYTLVEAYPKTGRTHQIRVHFREIGHPVVCDRIYGFKNASCPSALGRQFLHANFLEFESLDGGMIKIEADLPADLNDFLTGLRKEK